MVEEKIRAEQICIDDLFGDKYLFEIPNYQRSFVWEKDNFEQLFNDIKDEIEKSKKNHGNNSRDYEPYFLGSIVLHTKESKDDGSGRYDIIDGRQRLASLAILIAVMRDLATSVGSEQAKDTLQAKIYQKENRYRGTQESVRITVKDNEQDFFKTYILTPAGTEQTIISDRDSAKKLKNIRQKLNESGNRMLDAIEVFRDGFLNSEGKVDNELIDNYISYLLQKVVIVAVKTSSLASAFRLFKTLNKRGIELGSADILKSEVLSAIPDKERQKYAQKWESIEEEAGANKKVKLETLISFMRMIELPGRQKYEVFEEFEDRLFPNRPGFKGKQFIDYLSELKNIYKEKIEDSNIDSEIEKKKNEGYYYNLMSLMKNFFVFNEWMAAILHFHKKFSDDSYLFIFLKHLERAIFIDWITGATQEKRVARIYEIIKIINEQGNPRLVVEHSVFNEEIKAKQSLFEEAINDIGFYNKSSKKLARYTLLRIDMERSDNRNKISEYYGEITVEHILPENPYHEYWLERFNEDLRIEWTNRLGNLTLLDKKKNNKSANKPFPEKKAYFYERKGKTTIKSSFDLTNELQDYDDWSIDFLEERHDKLKREAINIWIK